MREPFRSCAIVDPHPQRALLGNPSKIPFPPSSFRNSRDTYVLGGDPPTDLDAGSRLAVRRRFPRFVFDARAELADPIAKSKLPGRVIEISQGGCFVAASEPPPVGSIIKLQIDKDGTLFNAWASVAYDWSGSGVGLRFIDVGADQMKVLSEWLREVKEPAKSR